MPHPVRFYRSLTLAALICLSGLMFAAIGSSGWSSCAIAAESRDLIRMDDRQYPGFSDDLNYRDLAESIDRTTSYLKRLPPDRRFCFGTDVYDARHMLKSMTHFGRFIQTRPSSGELNRFIAENYRVYRSRGKNQTRQVLFTGYYEPTVSGSRIKTPQYRYPVYSRPRDLVVGHSGTSVGRMQGNRLAPYPERHEIDKDPAFEQKAAPLAWAADPVALFFLHVQGSGKIAFPDGDFIRVGYDISNGRPYRSIGKYLIDKGCITASEVSMQSIRDYLIRHPKEIQEVLHYNPSYIFFKKSDGGPFGCLQTELIPGRSIASDKSVFPMPALAYIETSKPQIRQNGEIEKWVPCSRFVLNQDTGSAIKGPGRVDIFWGNGEYAEIAAGNLKHNGALYFLVLDPDTGSGRIY